MSWQDLEDGNAELATFGRERFTSRVAYLATVRKDGSPRVHPVTPIIGEGRLFLFMEPTSPKGFDLRRDPRYAMHASVEDAGGGGGEFFINGRATLIEDPETRDIAGQAASYAPAGRYILFELSVISAFSNIYSEEGPPRQQRWRRD
ncbi:MAG: pyridoxamine 5'-phosphate oxidase family protein [Candidatus Promineifilaceae bacterium]|nr:pyridoxamine 5'-phosphate oxidase family protein [Candidatus Promineifilaceae bacterium]